MPLLRTLGRRNCPRYSASVTLEMRPFVLINSPKTLCSSD